MTKKQNKISSFSSSSTRRREIKVKKFVNEFNSLPFDGKNFVGFFSLFRQTETIARHLIDDDDTHSNSTFAEDGELTSEFVSVHVLWWVMTFSRSKFLMD